MRLGAVAATAIFFVAQQSNKSEVGRYRYLDNPDICKRAGNRKISRFLRDFVRVLAWNMRRDPWKNPGDGHKQDVFRK